VGNSPRTNIKVGLELSQFQYALVTGTIFTFTNGFAGLVIGQYADKINRKWLLFAVAMGWNFFSFLESITQSFWQILLARIGFAMCMSGCVTCSVTLISDFSVPSERGIAQSIFAAGVYVGVGLSSMSIALDNAFGWRGAMQVIVAINTLFALTILFLKEPQRNLTNKKMEGVNVVVD